MFPDDSMASLHFTVHQYVGHDRGHVCRDEGNLSVSIQVDGPKLHGAWHFGLLAFSKNIVGWVSPNGFLVRQSIHTIITIDLGLDERS